MDEDETHNGNEAQLVSNTTADFNNLLKAAKIEIKNLVVKKTTLKRKITLILNDLKNKANTSNLSLEELNHKNEIISHNLSEVDVINDNIMIIFNNHGLFDARPSFQEQEIDAQFIYNNSVENQVSEIRACLLQNNTEFDNSEGTHIFNQSSKAELSPTVPIMDHPTSVIGERGNMECPPSVFKTFISPPKLEIPKFSGFGDFSNFYHLFDSVIGANDNILPRDKLLYLFSYLEKTPFDLIKHLSVNNDNYDIAIQILRSQYIYG